MSDPSKEAARLASTLPRDQLPTLTWRPPGIDGVRETQISDWHIPEMAIIGRDHADRYSCDLVIDELIGSGGLGMVHSAEQTSLNRLVAVKRVRADRLSEAAESQLRREAYLMGQLEHPAIPPVHLVGMADGRCVLVMRWVKGVPWDEKLAGHDIASSGKILEGPVLRAELNTLLRIGEAIAFAHDCKILHRDIKPGNVIVGEYGEVYLLDWGISVELNDDGLFDAVAFAGTPAFAAPEMIGRAPKLDARTDVYLLGATIYNIVTGRPPHQGNSAEEVFAEILKSPVPKISNDWPQSLAMLCRRSMSPDPADRYHSVRAMLEDLRYVIDYGELTDLEAQCDQDLAMLVEMSQMHTFDRPAFEEVGTRCRFGFERILEEWAGNPGITKKLGECLRLLCEASIARQNLAAARSLLTQYRDATGDEGEDRAVVMQRRIDALADQMIARGDELGMNIQVRLVEKLAAQQKAHEQLQAAYDQLREQHPDDA